MRLQVNKIHQIAFGLILTGLLLASAMPAPALADTEFLNDKAFHYGMSQADAAKMIYGEKSSRDWEIAYDIATASTWEIACRHHEEVQYKVRFFDGICIYVEKSVEMDSRDMEQTISAIFDVNGQTGEAAGNRKESQFFARWTQDDRAMELMAMRRRSTLFLLVYTDFDQARSNEAMLIRDRELKQGRMVIDPLTGQAMPHVESGAEQTPEDEQPQPEADEPAADDPEEN